MTVKLYRVRHRLSKGNRIIEPGTLSWLGWLDSRGIERLKERGAISEVIPPPLEVLPGWRVRARRLGKFGINTVSDLLAVRTEVVAGQMHVKPETVEGWKEEVRGWIKAPLPPPRKR